MIVYAYAYDFGHVENCLQAHSFQPCSLVAYWNEEIMKRNFLLEQILLTYILPLS